MNIHAKKIVTIFFILIIIISGFAVSETIALSRDTHSNINRHIAQGLHLDTYLKNQLGMPEGKDTFFKNKKVFDLVADGGAYEDNIPRPLAHFHNPLTNEGLWGNISAREWALLLVL